MDYREIANTYSQIEKTTKRLEITDLLVELLKKTPKDLISKVVYLTLGKLFPDFEGIEIGVAEKLAIKALSRVTGNKNQSIVSDLQKTGDIGLTAQKVMNNKKQTIFFKKNLTTQRVYETLEKMARTSGVRSIEYKLALLSGILSDASPKEAKYILRTVTGNLRLGLADMTILDALAITYGEGKKSRYLIERAYNISSDIGKVASVLAEKGLEGIKEFKVSIYEPIRPMLAERLSSAEEILEKLNGKCIAEFKYDGERIQIHLKDDKAVIYSRRLEKISKQYPDAIELVKKYVKAKEVILEGECVAMDFETGEMRPFQELMHRRRKYGIKKAIENYPVSIFLFDILYCDGEDLTREPYLKRRKILEQIISTDYRLKLAKQTKVKTVEHLNKFFDESISEGCEGVICKSIGIKSFYQAGARGWQWIKFKRDYKSELNDTVDLVVVGAFHGRGKRAGGYGALLLATYNKGLDTFETVTKCGTGFTDKNLVEIFEKLKKYEIKNKHPRLKSNIKADVWFVPSIVIEILGAEITLSPVHTCAMDSVRKGNGLAIRFPRFTGNYRIEKSAEDATDSTEITSLYQNQLKKINGK